MKRKINSISQKQVTIYAKENRSSGKKRRAGENKVYGDGGQNIGYTPPEPPNPLGFVDWSRNRY